MKILRFAALILGFALLAGCVADKLVVFEKALLSENEMKPFLGNWEAIECHDPHGKKVEFEKGTRVLTMEKKGMQYQYSMKWVAEGKKKMFSGTFMLSKIPGSKSGLLLLSSPKHNEGETKLSNAFGIMKRHNDMLYFWVVQTNMPVVEQRLKQNDDKSYTAESVKTFLKQYADAFVLANPPTYSFKKQR